MRLLTLLAAGLPLVSAVPASAPQPALSFNPPTDSIQRRGNVEGPFCGVVGSDLHNPKPFVEKSLKCSATKCPDLCKATSGCQSYAVSTTKCLLYAAPVAGNFLPDPLSPYTYYDLTCLDVETSTTALPTSSTEVASSTTATEDTSTTAETTAETTTDTTTEEASTTAAETTTEDASTTLTTIVTTTEDASTSETTAVPTSTTSEAASTTTASVILRLEYADTDELAGYVGPTLNGIGERVVDTSAALTVKFEYAVGAESITQANIIHESVGGLIHLAAGAGFSNVNNNLGPGSYHYAYLVASDSTPPGSLPQSGVTNTFTVYSGVPTEVESAIWSIDFATNRVTPQWINEDGTTVTTHVVSVIGAGGIIALTGDPTVFANTFGESRPLKIFAEFL